jgi:4-methylaminobutanoate oxidase (formaldehyde-forming)
MFPLMNMEGVLGAAFTPNDGMIDPTGLTMALAKGAKMRGVQFFEETEVTAIHI